MGTIIRASSLSHYSDCTRRAVVKMFADEIKECGFEIAPVKTSAGAAVGTATHKALETALLLRAKGEPFLEAMKDAARDSMAESTVGGIIWDDTTFDRDAGTFQAVRQARVVIDMFPELQEISVEDEFTADLGDGFTLSGHIDIRGRDGEKQTIYDLKTGTVKRVNIPQYGAYSLLVRSNGFMVHELGEIYVKRVGKTKAQPYPVVSKFKPSEAERFAGAIIRRIKADLTEFRNTGNPWVWLPNPNSMMCTPDYCPAYGTKFCNCKQRRK